MESILNTYKERLVNISARNRSLVTRKLYKKRAFDLHKLKKFNKNIDEDIINFIMDRKNSSIEVLEDHVKYLQQNLSLIEAEIKKEESLELLKIGSDKSLDDETKKNKEKLIKDNLELKLRKKSEDVKKKSEDIADLSKGINYLLREINAVEKETGRYELYVGYNFVEGRFKDGTFVKAPLLMFPIRIIDNKGNWELKNILEQDILLNKVFLLAISKYNSIEVDKIQTEYESIKGSFKSIDDLLKYLSEYGIYIQRENKELSTKFVERKREEDSIYKYGELFLNPYLILGQFPVANSIYDDYQDLGKIYNGINEDDSENHLLNQLLLNEPQNEYDLNESNEYYRNRKLKEEDYYFITPLDFSQEKAVKTVNETNQLVIYGPPGTGKSQTISNIIADAMAKNKKILMVSQKRAALDVIYNRLGELSKKAIIIHDANKDKKAFYAKVVNGIEDAAYSQTDDLSNSLYDKAKSIDKNIERLEVLGYTLTKNRKFGMTLQQMYSNSKQINSKEDSRYEDYRIFRINNILKDNTYDEIKDSIEDIENKNIFNDYYKYKELVNKYPMLLNIKDGLDRFDIDDFENKLTEIQSEYKNKIYIGYKDKNYYMEVIEYYKNIDDEVSDEVLVKLAREINKNQNSFLLNSLKKEDYISKVTYKTEGEFTQLISLHNELEDEVTNTQIKDLASKINESKNSFLLKTLTKKEYEDKIEVKNKKYLSKYLELYTDLEVVIEESEILQLADDLNKETNNYLLEPINYGKWYTLKYWKNKKSNKQKEIDNQELYNKRKLSIHEILTEYRNDITEYVKVTKRNNKQEYEYRKNEIYNKLNRYKKDIEKYIEENKYKNKVEYEKRYQIIYEELKLIKDNIDKFKSDMKILDSIILENKQFEYKEKMITGYNLNEYIYNIIEAFKVYEEVSEIKFKSNKLENTSIKILNYIFEKSNNENQGKKLLNEILEFTILYQINEIEKCERVNIDIYEEFSNIVYDVNMNLVRRRGLVPKYILDKLNDRFEENVESNVSRQVSKEFGRQAKKKRQLWPIRRYVKEFDKLLLDLFPCWLLGPETVSEILPLDSGMFDIVIFDEASQMFIETAIPTIYRGNKVIIAGDDKQLRPSSTFSAKIDEDEEHDELEVAAALEEESLLDLAKVNYDSVCLNYHYRSKYDELINFSNYAFYGGKLDVSPNTVKTDLAKDKPIERVKVDGRWIDRKNEIEAKEVVKLVKKILHTRKSNESIGIITFNIGQQDLIEDMLEYECSNDIEFRNLYNAEKSRIENNEDISLFIKNIENVQGDERDIIIFSTGYAPNEKNRVSLNFGSLSKDGGENRLNVAISRAKEKIYVITSIEPEQLSNVESTKNRGPKLLKKYLEYVRNVSDGNKEGASIVLNSILDSDVERNIAVTFDSVFEEEVYDALSKEGFDVDTQIGVSGYKIDLGIYDRNNSKYILGIECDGAAYHSSKEARERDIHRQRYLESRGWKIVRIWSKDWWQNPKKEIQKIKDYIG
ncbi:AAA domain-containing protein [Terrisporobacter hibernicus]|uniref:AAA family ATPase n=1 Tax=Terrisporobacter hibernicus TaxID=2813371 RepID=A0AAX2ZEM5_9FIRM|nr:AAA domain-containing protein [Terrisporobacter hibernicus]UEL47185.1 AAA family ATPase [Terrisporobacter hibernicus]